jgi:hypothetical protein
MHNRPASQQNNRVASREIGWRDGIVLAPLVLCILGLALYPQLILHRTAPTVQQTVASVTNGSAPEAQLATSGSTGRNATNSVGNRPIDHIRHHIDVLGVSEPGE